MFDNDDATYFVVINEEEQYSIWPEDRIADLPDGWASVSSALPRQQCLDHIEDVWTDMRPKSLRLAMDQQA